MLLTGDSLSGVECAARGWATASFRRGTGGAGAGRGRQDRQLPPDIVQLNKRAVHRQMDAMGLRQGIRAGTRCARWGPMASFKAFINNIQQQGLTGALQQQDEIRRLPRGWRFPQRLGLSQRAGPPVPQLINSCRSHSGIRSAGIHANSNVHESERWRPVRPWGSAQ